MKTLKKIPYEHPQVDVLDVEIESKILDGSNEIPGEGQGYQAMKHIILSVVFATVICSCAVQEPYEIIPECKEVVFTAYSGETNTKTVLQPNGRIYWAPGDEICIYYGSSDGNRFTADIESLAEKATFRGKLDGFTGTTESGSYNYFWALYPYSSAISCDGTGIRATLNPLQEAKTNSFANNTNITLAKS